MFGINCTCVTYRPFLSNKRHYLLSSRLYCRYRNSFCLRKSPIPPHRYGSRTIPPVGTCTLPRRSYSIYSIHYKSIVLYFQGLCFLFNLYFHIFTSTNPPKKQIFLWVVTFLIYFIIFLFLLSLFHVYKYCNNIIFLSDALISPSKIPLYPFFSYLVQIFSYLVQKFLTFFTHFLCILKVFSDENTFS